MVIDLATYALRTQKMIYYKEQCEKLRQELARKEELIDQLYKTCFSLSTDLYSARNEGKI